MPSDPAAGDPASGEERSLLTINEAARLASVSRKSIYRWIKAGILEHRILPSGTIRIYQESLLRAPGLRAGRPAAPEARTPRRPRASGGAAAPGHRRHST